MINTIFRPVPGYTDLYAGMDGWFLAADPWLPDRLIAEAVGVSLSTVLRFRHEMKSQVTQCL